RAGAAVPTINISEGMALDGVTVANFSDDDPGGTVGDYTTTIDWGDGAVTTGVVSRSVAPGTGFVVAGSHVYPGEGSYAIRVSIVDTDGPTPPQVARSSVVVFTGVSVTDAPLAAVTTPATIAAVEGATVSDAVVATFSDADPGGNVADY